jgi:hypothetical protein
MQHHAVRELVELSGALAIAWLLGSSGAFAAPDAASPEGSCPTPGELKRVTLDFNASVDAPHGFDALAYYNKETNQPLKDLSSRLKNNSWIVQGDDLVFDRIPRSDVKSIVLGWTKRAEGKKSPLCFQEVEVPVASVVLNAYCNDELTKQDRVHLETPATCSLGDPLSIENPRPRSLDQGSQWSG